MSHLCHAAIILLCLLVPVRPASGQTVKDATRQPAAKQPAPASDAARKDKAEAQAETDRIAKEQRTQARSLLLSLASDARSFREQTLRARTLARIADALWDSDVDRGRELFRKAWEAAEIADADRERKIAAETQDQKAKPGGGYAISTAPIMCTEVLRLAAGHDRALGEEFLDQLKRRTQQAADASTAQPFSLTEVQSERLGLAERLLDAGDSERALQFADPVLNVISIKGLNFLENLRDKNAAAADQRYAALLAGANVDPQADANTVSLLSSYIFTPHLFIRFSNTGTSTSQMAEATPPANVTPELRNAFFQTAAGILLRPQPPPEQDQGTAGVGGKYLVIKRLLPLFEQYTPGETIAALRGQLDALLPLVSKDTKQRDDDEYVRKGVRPDNPIEDQEQPLLDRLDHAKTSADRDWIYVQLAHLALKRTDLRTRDFVEKIDELELRKDARAYFDPALAMRAIERKNTEQVFTLVKDGELTHIQRSWLFMEVAKLSIKANRDRALLLVDEALTEARRIDGSDPDRPRAFLGVVNILLLGDRERAWEVAFDAVKAANSVEGFSGEDGGLMIKLQRKGHSSVSSRDVNDFDVDHTFKALANLDYDRAVDLARGFQGEAPRAAAVIAIARAVLSEKKPTSR
jgi:hypothetical protein